MNNATELAKELVWEDCYNANDPVSANEVAYIEVIPHSVGNLKANYTVRKDHWGNGWQATFWCGNQGRPVTGGYFATTEEAKLACQQHLNSIISQNSNAPELAQAVIDLSARVEELEKGWQPIETAPKDGTRILGLTSFGDIEICEYCTITNYTYEEAGDGLFGRTVHVDEFWSNNKPTHWMPLPAPPAAEKMGER